jgi:uncharacterized protein
VTATAPELRIGVSELRRRPGNRRHVERSLPLGGTSISTAAVPDGAEATVEVTLESLSDGVTATGTVSVSWTGPCRRCLEDTDGVVVAEIHEVFTERPLGGETLALDGDTLDLGPVVRDAVVLHLPLAPLCREDCPGPAPDEFPVATAGDDVAPVDPRWSALAELQLDPEPPGPLDPGTAGPVE